jgi:peroxin-6
MLSVVQIIPLQEVFVQALSSTAYRRAMADVLSFEDWLCSDQRILRQGSAYTLDAQDGLEPGSLTYKLIMTEPVLQGYAQKSQTLFTLLPPAEDSPAINGRQVSVSSPPLEDVQIDDGEEDLEIGESFLASSLIPQSSSYSQQNDSSTIRMSYNVRAYCRSPKGWSARWGLGECQLFDLKARALSNGCQAIAQIPSSRNRRIVKLEANDETVGDS